ncbi:MAG: DUF2090 domain-containing protein [Burkholderiaceae bacterium]|jgi:myo-inositol catabolism protein IolC
MKLGYTRPLYILPFDHRESYMSGLFHYERPLSAEQQERVADSKRVIYEGFLAALHQGVSKSKAGILVDEEFGAEILKAARQDDELVALSVEQSGQELFHFAYGDAFAAHIEAFRPTFAKVLVRYNPATDGSGNEEQAARLKMLSEYCREHGPAFMFELLVPATQQQMADCGGDKRRYDASVRPELMLRAIAELQDFGVEPDIWKIEGLDTRAHYEALVAQARRAGRDDVGCIVLGRGAEEDVVEHWLATAVDVPGMIGFAVGRTVFWDPIVQYEAGQWDRKRAAAEIATRYRRWVDLFENPPRPA